MPGKLTIYTDTAHRDAVDAALTTIGHRHQVRLVMRDMAAFDAASRVVTAMQVRTVWEIGPRPRGGWPVRPGALSDAMYAAGCPSCV